MKSLCLFAVKEGIYLPREHSRERCEPCGEPELVVKGAAGCWMGHDGWIVDGNHDRVKQRTGGMALRVAFAAKQRRDVYWMLHMKICA